MAIGMRHCLGTTLPEVENLRRKLVRTDGILKKNWQWHTRRQANTGLNMTLKGILIADIACRGLAT